MSFENIQLIECSRNQSNEAESNNDSNYSMWTNRLGRTIELDVGDTVELKSAFINQRGCADPSSLEFKGEDLGVKVSYEVTKSSSKYPDIYVHNILNVGTLNPLSTTTITGNLGFRQISNEEEEHELKDNVLNLEINFYKNSNGEETFMLPRMYNRTPAPVTDADYVGAQTWDQFWDKANIDYDFHQVNGYDIGHNSGIPRLSIINTLPLEEVDEQSLIPLFNNNDWVCIKTDSTTFLPYPTNVPQGTTQPQPYAPWELKPRNDNSRFTLFEREYDWLTWSYYAGADRFEPGYYFENDDGTETRISSYSWWTETNLPPDFPEGYRRLRTRSPALWRYVKRSDFVQVEIEKGFNSPSSVAQQITQQLQEQNPDSPVVESRKVDYFNGQYQINMFESDETVGFNTPTFKPVYAPTFQDFNFENHREYFDKDTAINEGNPAFNYWRTHHNIYVKRPEVFIEGRKCNNRFGYVNTPLEDPEKDIDLLGGGTPNFILNTINYDPTDNLYVNNTDEIVTSWVYNKTNLNRLKALFEAQGKYPDLFHGKADGYGYNQIYYNRTTDGAGNVQWNQVATIDNSRYLHMNRFDNVDDAGDPTDPALNFNILGDDGHLAFTYTTAGGTRFYNISHVTMPIFFYFDKANKDKFTSGDDVTDLCYGFAGKRRVNTAFGDHEYITLHPELLHGIRQEAFRMRGGCTVDNRGNTKQTLARWEFAHITGGTCMIGFDYHFNSFGNLCLLKHQGLTTYSRDEKLLMIRQLQGLGMRSDNTQFGLNAEVNRRMDLTYIGANSVACVYDTTSNKFGFEYLHTPERVGNKFNSGKTENISTDPNHPIENTLPIISDAQQEVYKINKRIEAWTFNPDMCPYYTTTTIKLDGHGAADPSVDWNQFNPNLEAWRIYDSHMGVMLNFGKSAKIDTSKYSQSQEIIWNNSVLGIMGFSYDQFNPPEINELNNTQARVKNNNIKTLFNPTTNSAVVNAQTNQYVMNPYGAIQYTTQMPFATIIRNVYYNGATATTNRSYFPAIVEQTNSIKIEGDFLPRVVLKPYLTIRTDILSQDRYIGGINSGLVYPVIASVNRINAEKDFVQLEGGEVFTITSKTSFNSITTAITDPTGRLSRVDDGSAVIYKITKQDNVENYNVLGRIVEKLKK